MTNQTIQRPSLQEQIAHHRAAIADLSKRASLCDTCGLRKSAAHWRAAIAASESCIRACESRVSAALTAYVRQEGK
jgi:hypothetical protein